MPKTARRSNIDESGISAEVVETPPQTLEEVDVARHREITSKAVSAILLLLLKWFKASREIFLGSESARADHVPATH